MKQPEDKFTVDIEDVFIWPNGEWCFRYELSEMTHKSDDYLTVFFGTEEWEELFKNRRTV